MADSSKVNATSNMIDFTWTLSDSTPAVADKAATYELTSKLLAGPPVLKALTSSPELDPPPRSNDISISVAIMPSGAYVGTGVGSTVGKAVGAGVVGSAVGPTVAPSGSGSVGANVGSEVGDEVGDAVGDADVTIIHFTAMQL